MVVKSLQLTFWNTLSNLESSANIANVQWLIAFRKSLVYTKNKMGPSMDPWGTPYQTLTGSNLRKIHWWPPVAFDGWGSSQTKWEEDHVYQTNLVSEAVWWGRQSQMPLQSLTESDQSLDQHPDVYKFHCALRGVDLHKIFLSRSHAGGHIVGIW